MRGWRTQMKVSSCACLLAACEGLSVGPYFTQVLQAPVQSTSPLLLLRVSSLPHVLSLPAKVVQVRPRRFLTQSPNISKHTDLVFCFLRALAQDVNQVTSAIARA